LGILPNNSIGQGSSSLLSHCCQIGGINNNDNNKKLLPTMEGGGGDTIVFLDVFSTKGEEAKGRMK
jgi:hypothetical protein